MITIKKVQTSADRKKFIRFAWDVNKKDKSWVPPLISEKREFLNPKKNPYFKHSAVELIMAYKGRKPVGRISVHENTQHNKRHNDHMGFFGFFECIDDQEVANILLDHAKAWLEDRGYHGMRGPMSFSINSEYALLVDGFEYQQMVQMTHNPPYYEKLLTNYGFKGSQDMYAYRINANDGLPEKIMHQADVVKRALPNLKIRSMNIKKIKREAKIVHKIYTEAWDKNWGAVPMTKKEVTALAKELKFFLDPDLAYFAELDGKPVGFSLTLPNIYEALQLANGKLFPFGLLKILRKRKHLQSMRVFAMGVLKEYRHRGIDTLFYKKTVEAAQKKGYEYAEMSLINESNTPMRKVLERLGARIYKTYRMYDYIF